MLIAFLIALQLVQVDNFVTLEICFLDYNSHPWEFRPHPTFPPAKLRANSITGMIDARVGLNVGGIDCTKIYGAPGSVFVVGTPEQIRQKIKAAEGGAR